MIEMICERCCNEMKETDNITETENGDYVCDDCRDSMNDRYEMMKDDIQQEGEVKS